jgi:uncharacterized protein
VAQAESFLRGQGFPWSRPHHGRLAHRGISPEIARLAEEPLRSQVTATLGGLGYVYVCLDLQGFRSGSLNEVLEGYRPINPA